MTKAQSFWRTIVVIESDEHFRNVSREESNFLVKGHGGRMYFNVNLLYNSLG